MGFLDRLFGRKEESRARSAAPTSSLDRGQQSSDADEQVLQRYRYMLKTAPPETIEQAHEEAFAKLTPAQRAQALRELAAETPEEERAALAGSRDDPKTLARLATRAEMRQPGATERTLGGTGMGGMMAGTIFGSLVAGFVGSIVAQQFLDSVGDFGEDDPSVEPEDEPSDESAGGDFGRPVGISAGTSAEISSREHPRPRNAVPKRSKREPNAFVRPSTAYISSNSVFLERLPDYAPGTCIHPREMIAPLPPLLPLLPFS